MARGDGQGLVAVTPLARPGPLRHQVEEALQDLVVTGALAPGQHLVEAEMAERLQVSRGPVREAFQALHRDGWLDLRPGRGAFVHDPTVAEVDEVFGVRAALEGEAAALAAARVTPDQVAELRELSARGRRAARSGDYDRVVATNSELHRRVAVVAGSGLLAELVASLDGRVRWYLRPVVHDRAEASWDEHDALVDALADGAAELATRLMRAHVERSRQASVRARS